MKYAPEGLDTCCPDALVRRSYDCDQYVMNGGYTLSAPLNIRNIKYECAKCGRELTIKKRNS